MELRALNTATYTRESLAKAADYLRTGHLPRWVEEQSPTAQQRWKDSPSLPSCSGPWRLRAAP